MGSPVHSNRRDPGGQVGFARELQVERLKLSRGTQQERGCFAAEPRGEGNPGAQQVDPRELELVEWSSLRCSQESERRIEGARLEARLRGSQRAPGPVVWVGCQFRGTGEESCRRGEAATLLGTCRRTFQFGRYFFVGGQRGVCAMPGAAIRVDVHIGRLGECAMDAMEVGGMRRSVDGRSDEWVCELDACPKVEKPRVGRELRGSHVDAECLGDTVEQDWIAQGVRGGGENQELCLGGKLAKTMPEAFFDSPGYPASADQSEAAGKVYGSPCAWQL